jgi:FAD/FMN-containing dehydrogenase
VIEGDPSGLFVRVAAAETAPAEGWEERSRGWRSARTVARTLVLREVVSAVVEWMPPRNAEIVTGLLRLISQPAVGDGCTRCAGMWHCLTDRATPDCRFCHAVVDAALREELPPLPMLACEVGRVLSMIEGDEGPLLREVLRWCREASHPLGCPMCDRRAEPTIPSAQGWICRTCLFMPVLAQRTPRRARVDLEGPAWGEALFHGN